MLSWIGFIATIIIFGKISFLVFRTINGSELSVESGMNNLQKIVHDKNWKRKVDFFEGAFIGLVIAIGHDVGFDINDAAANGAIIGVFCGFCSVVKNEGIGD